MTIKTGPAGPPPGEGMFQAAGCAVMSIGQSLSQLVLKRLVEDVFTTGGADALDGVHDFLALCGRENGPRLSAVLDQALERSWRALEVALGDDRFWDHGQVGLAPGDAQAFRQRLEMVLAELTRGSAAERPEWLHLEAALRRQCLWELRAAREAGALTDCLDADEWTRFPEVFAGLAVGPGGRDGVRSAEGELFRAFEERGCVGLMRVLTGGGGLPLLIGVVRAFVCQGLRRLLRYCLQERPEQTPRNCALVMDVLRQLSTPRFSARRTTSPALTKTSPNDGAAEAPVPARAVERVPQPQPRRYERRQPAPARPPGATPTRRNPRPLSLPSVPTLPRPRPRTARTRNVFSGPATSPRMMRGALALGIVLLVVLPAWLLVSEAQQRSAEQRRVAAERQRLADEVRRLDEERRLLVERQQRLAEAETARRREAERQRREEDQRRRAEAEQARRRAEEQAVREREEERKQRETDRRARLRAEKERRERAKIVFERARTHAACRRDEKALAAFDETLRLDPNIARAWTERGVVRRRLGDVQGALADFTEAVRHDPRDALAWLARGELHAARHDNSLAIESFSAVIRLDPRSALAYRERGACHVQNYDYPPALADETAAIALTPGDPWPYFHRANVHALRNDMGKAFDDYTSAIERNRNNDPGLAPAYRQRGTIRLQREEYAAAIDDLAIALRFNPEDAASRQARGLAYLKRGEWDSAVLDASEAIRLDPDNAEGYKIRGQAYLARDDCRAARTDLTRAIALHRTDSESYYLRARARARLGERDEAIYDCNDALARNPHLASAYYLRGTLLIQQNDRAHGLADRRKAHELNPLYPRP